MLLAVLVPSLTVPRLRRFPRGHDPFSTDDLTASPQLLLRVKFGDLGRVKFGDLGRVTGNWNQTNYLVKFCMR